MLLAATHKRGLDPTIHAHRPGVVTDADEFHYTTASGAEKTRHVVEGDRWGEVRCGAELVGFVIGDDEFNAEDQYACPECVAATA